MEEPTQQWSSLFSQMGQSPHPRAVLHSNETQRSEGLVILQACPCLSVGVGLTLSVCPDPNRKQDSPQMVQRT